MPKSFFSKVAYLRPATLLKRDSGTGEFCKFLKNTVFYRATSVATSESNFCVSQKLILLYFFNH